MPSPSLIACRWDWCRSSFASIDALDKHVKHEHIWPMKPMRKADIALMRRMDMQSLHSSQDTESSIISRGFIGASQNETPPLAVSHTSTPTKHPENEPPTFDTFTQLSSPLQAQSPQRLPASPALEGLIRHHRHSGLSAAVEMFERAYAPRRNQGTSSSLHQGSPTHRPLSNSSASSQEAVEHQLTQADDIGSQPQLLLPPELQIDNELVDAELRWPTDDELDIVPTEEKQSTSEQSPNSARGQNFRHGSLNVPLGINSRGASPPQASQGSHSESQPFVLLTQAPYSSQSSWSQSQHS